MSVPSNQTLILKGFKDHADYRNVITFLKELGVMAGCMFINPSSIVPDAYNKDDGGQIAYVNYHSPAAAARSLQKCQRYAAQLDQGTAKQYGFLARLTVGCKDRNVTAASDSDEGESLCEHLERLLRGAPGGIDGVQVESIARERGEWQDEVNDAGGVKTFVQAHCAARLEWYFSTVRLLATPSQNQGAAGGQQRAATSVPESEAATLCQHLEGLLRDTPGGLHAPQVGFIARERGEWQDEVNEAGGVKKFVQDNCAGKLEWYHDGGSDKIRLAATSEPEGAAGGQQRAATSVPESEAATLCQHLEGLLHSTNDTRAFYATQVGVLARERREWQDEVKEAGGIKKFVQNRCAGKLEWHHDGPPDGGSDLVCLAESPDASGGAVEASSLCVEAASPEASAEEGAAVSGEEGALEAWRAGVWTYLNTTGPDFAVSLIKKIPPPGGKANYSSAWKLLHFDPQKRFFFGEGGLVSAKNTKSSKRKLLGRGVTPAEAPSSCGGGAARGNAAPPSIAPISTHRLEEPVGTNPWLLQAPGSSCRGLEEDYRLMLLAYLRAVGRPVDRRQPVFLSGDTFFGEKQPGVVFLELYVGAIVVGKDDRFIKTKDESGVPWLAAAEQQEPISPPSGADPAGGAEERGRREALEADQEFASSSEELAGVEEARNQQERAGVGARSQVGGPAVSEGPAQTGGAPPKFACTFFRKDTCRKGDSCPFSHDPSAPDAPIKSAPPPRVSPSEPRPAEVKVEEDAGAAEAEEAGAREDAGDPRNKALAEITEEGNFARFCRLLHEVCPEVLSAIFRIKWRENTGGEWADGAACGGALFAKIDDVTQRKLLGKAAVNQLREGASKKWDVTLLTSLLLFQPGYCKVQPVHHLSGDKDHVVVEALEKIRKSRNAIAHSTKRSMADADFKASWAGVVGSLESIISTFPADDTQVQQLRGNIEKVYTEKGLSSHVDHFMTVISGVESEMQRLAEEQERNVTKTEAGRMIETGIQKVLNPSHKFDPHRFPLPVHLDNGADYTLLRRAGEGGFGTVFEAYDPVTRGLVAFKKCEAQGELDRGDREAKILQTLLKLKHPHIVAFLSSSTLQGQQIVVMELVKGDSLKSFLDNEGAFGVERAKTLMLQLTDGMSAVHSLKISHRDLKPANIMFDEVTGIATIVDFGLSKEQNTNSTVTNSSGAKIGTVLYMSPEQTEGDVSKIGAPADVWALGVIFYEILTGQHPFLPLCLRPSPSPAAGGSSPKPPLMMSKKEEGVLVWRICEMECPPLPVTPASASLAEVVFRALKKDQDERYKDAGEMHAHLKETFASPEAPVEPEGGSARPHDSWTEIELAAFVRRLGPKFSEAAATIEEDCVNGMLWNELVKEKAITKSLADGGLGLSPLQLKRVQQELRVL